MSPSADALYQRGLDLTRQRRFGDARAALEEASSLADEPDLVARIAGTLGFVLAQLGEPARGESMCRTALDTQGISDHTRGTVAGQLGSLMVAQGRLDEALEWLGVGIDTIPGDPVAVANLRQNRSLVHMQRVDIPASIADIEATLPVFAEHGGPTDVAEARHNLGYVALLGGDLVRAMAEMSAARPVIAAASPANAAISDVDMAEVLRDAGLVTEAEQRLRRAARAFGDDRMPQARAEAELHLAKSLLRHDPAEAVRVARAAARRFRALGARSWAARADGIRLRAVLAGDAAHGSRGGSARGRRRPDDAEIDRVARALVRAGLRSDALSLRLARELARARQGMAGARMPAITASASLEARLLAHEVRAVRAAHAGRESAARRHAAAGLDELAEWRASFGSLDLQTSVAMHGNGLMLAGIGSAVRTRRPELVFEWSERARHLSQQVVPLRPPPDPALATELAELRMLRADLPGSDWLADPRAVDLAGRVRERQWTSTAAAAVEPRLELDAFGSALDADTALLSFVFGPDGLVCLIVTQSGARVVDVPEWQQVRPLLRGLRADLDMTASVRTGPLAEVVGRSLAARLGELSRALLDGPLAACDARRLVITVPGVLTGLPWAMLPALRGRVFTLAASATRWAAARVEAPRTAGFAAGPRVARGDEEVRAAARAWPAARALRGDEATVDAVSALGGEVDLLHVAAHGRHAADNPLFSGLELSDGALFGYDIDRMPRVPATVILSACEVGRSAVRWGEEAIGMTRAWLHAGARCVVAAPVVVADDDACVLLGAMHAELAAGRLPAEALAAAQASTGVIAPFQCHGSGF